MGLKVARSGLALSCTPSRFEIGTTALGTARPAACRMVPPDPMHQGILTIGAARLELVSTGESSKISQPFAGKTMTFRIRTIFVSIALSAAVAVGPLAAQQPTDATPAYGPELE